MKKIILVVLAIGILVSFTGCDWFRGIFGIGSVELSVDSVMVAEVDGIVTDVSISIQNYGDNDAEGVSYALVFSSDDVMDYYNDTIIYENSVDIYSYSWHYEDIYWDTIETYINNNSVMAPVEEGYIGLVVDPNGNFDEDEGTWDNSDLDWNMTAVPSPDEWEYNDDDGSATPVTFDNTIQNTIFPYDESDWFSFWADNTRTYDIVTSAVGNVSSDTWIDVYNPSVIWEDSDLTGSGGGGEYAALYSWTPATTGMYYVEVTSDNFEPGLYSFTVTEYP